jgi:hypothetical protein
MSKRQASMSSANFVNLNTSSEEEEPSESVSAVDRNYRRALKADQRKMAKKTKAALTFQRRFRGLKGRRSAARKRMEKAAAEDRPLTAAEMRAARLKFFEKKTSGGTRRH